MINKLRAVGKRVLGANGNPLLPPRTRSHLQALREYELELVLPLLEPGCSVLEVGAGTGWQSKRLSEAGFSVSAIDLCSSNYAGERIFEITDYDGKNIPFPSAKFDVVFSSSTLEHIPELTDFLAHELPRVLKPGGIAVHIVPSASWRFWTIITFFARFFFLDRNHGEHSSNAFTEILRFSRRYWTKVFRLSGWGIERYSTNGIFYTGACMLDSCLGIQARQDLSRLLGSSCHIFVLSHSSFSLPDLRLNSPDVGA